MYDRIHLMLTVYNRYTCIYRVSYEYLKYVMKFFCGLSNFIHESLVVHGPHYCHRRYRRLEVYDNQRRTTMRKRIKNTE